MITYIVLALNISNIAGSALNIYHSHKEASLGRRYIGWSSIMISLILMVTYIDKALNQIDFIYYNPLLNTTSIFLWSVSSVLLFLYPMLEYRADLISKKLFIRILHPSIILGIILLSTYWLEYPFTRLYAWKDLVSNIHLHDVQFRLFLTLSSTVISIFYLYFPIVLSKISSTSNTRKFSKWYFSFFILGNVLIILYLPFSLIETPEIKVAFRLLLMLLLNTITYSYMIPQLSITMLRRTEDGALNSSDSDSPSRKPAFANSTFLSSLHNEVLTRQLYLNPSISIDELAKKLNTTRPVLVDLMAKMDYNGYFEYMNALRVNHFKEIAKNQPKTPVSELYLQAGFATLSGFNRIFLQMEAQTPSQYMEKLNKLSENSTLEN